MEKKSYRISVRVTKENYDKFNNLAEINETNKSDYLNDLIKKEYDEIKEEE